LNPLIQHRGQPSTHDLPLALCVLRSLRDEQPTKIPRYDKGAFDGAGDRVPEEQWGEVNSGDREKIKIVILEGWCVGFRALGHGKIEEKWREATNARGKGGYDGRLGFNRLEDVLFVDDALRGYGELTE
jgi:D-glycerate 3-kinase